MAMEKNWLKISCNENTNDNIKGRIKAEQAAKERFPEFPYTVDVRESKFDPIKYNEHQLAKRMGFIIGAEWQSAQQWIAISETQKPTDNKYVLFYNGHWIGVGKYRSQTDDEYESHYQDEINEYINPEPTHWMPLPQPPNDIANGRDQL